MSISLQKEVWKLDLPPSEKLVLLRMADYARDKDKCAFPSVRNVARETGLSERQVQRYLKAFVSAGFLEIADYQEGGRGRTRVYQFTLGKGDTGDATLNEERVTPVTVKGDTCDAEHGPKRVTSEPERVTPEDVKGDTFARAIPKPPINHQKEPSVVEPMKRNGAAQTLVATLYEDVLEIGPPTGYSTVVGQAQALVKAGCTPEELRDIAEWLQADPFWSKKGITMGTILSQRDNWRTAKRSAGGSWQVHQGGKPLHKSNGGLTAEGVLFAPLERKSQ